MALFDELSGKDYRTPGINPQANDPYVQGTQGTMLERRDARKRMQETNPLSAFGFLTAQERAQGQALAEQQEYARALQFAQLSPLQAPVMQMQLASNGIAKGINKFIAKRKGGATSQAGDDPEVAQFNKLVDEFDGDVPKAMIAMGKELVKKGDARGVAMIQKGRESAAEQGKADTELEAGQLGIQKTKQDMGLATAGAKIGDVRTVQYGDQQQQQEVVDIKNGRPIWADLGTKGARSPKQTVQNLDDPRTATQEGAAYQKLVDKATYLKGAFDEIDNLVKTATENPGVIGLQGFAVEKAYNIYEATKNGIQYGILDKKISPELQSKIDNAEQNLSSFDLSGIEKVGITNPQVQAQFVRLAYGLAASSEQGGRTISDRDVNFWMKSIGAGLSDPRALAKLLARTKYGLARDYVNAAEFNSMGDKAPALDFFKGVRDGYDPDGAIKPPSGGGMTSAQKKRLEELRKKYGN